MDNSRIQGMHEAKKTVYKDVFYRSRLEACYAAFLDECGMRKDYETRSFKVGRKTDGSGLYYRPDFLVYDVEGVGDLYIEVKGNRNDALGFEKIKLFAEKYPILVVSALPMPRNIETVDAFFEDEYGRDPARPIFSWKYINGQDKCAYLGMTVNGGFGIFTKETLAKRDSTATLWAISNALDAVKEKAAILEGRLPEPAPAPKPEPLPPPVRQEEQLALKLNALFGGGCDAIEITPRNREILRTLASVSQRTVSETANSIIETFCREHHIVL